MNTDSLRQAQQALATRIQQPEAPADAALHGLLHPLHGRADSLPVSLGIYRQAWQARLTEALRSNHPVLHRVLGDEAFRELALRYAAAHPPHRPSIRWFGDALADFLRTTPDALPHPALLDLARMEWALGLSFDSADAPPLTGAALADLAPADWPALRFLAHPSLHLLTLDWAVEPLWQRLTLAPEDEATEAPEAFNHTLLVWRQGLDTRWRSLPADEAALLHAAVAGECFEALGLLAAQRVGEAEAPALLAAALQTWLAHGLLCPPTWMAEPPQG